ncbi:PaaI family thioesterase [Pseudidiomarina sediminum]|nr:PaaI family thioesterase [Pseudidiomarina sediminum]
MNQPDMMLHLPGMERLAAIEASCQHSGMVENLGLILDSAEPGKVTYHYQLKARHVNHIGSLHGGIAATLADSAMAAAALTTLPPNEWITMTDLSIKFIRAVFALDETLTIEGRVDHAGKRMFATNSVILNSEGKIVARAMANAIRLKKDRC